MMVSTTRRLAGDSLRGTCEMPGELSREVCSSVQSVSSSDDSTSFDEVSDRQREDTVSSAMSSHSDSEASTKDFGGEMDGVSPTRA